jgi:hypothetical protein
MKREPSVGCGRCRREAVVEDNWKTVVEFKSELVKMIQFGYRVS